jgi:hypothetical protein
MKLSNYDLAGIFLTMILAMYLLEIGVKPDQLAFWIISIIPIVNFFLGRSHERNL